AGLRPCRGSGRLRDATAKLATIPADFPVDLGEYEQYPDPFATERIAGAAISVLALIVAKSELFKQFTVDAFTEFVEFKRIAFVSVAVDSRGHAVIAFTTRSERNAAGAIAIQFARNAFFTVVFLFIAGKSGSADLVESARPAGYAFLFESGRSGQCGWRYAAFRTGRRPARRRAAGRRGRRQGHIHRRCGRFDR
ncbi:MAG: hypothetical protein OXI17_14270, partial [Gammaproteobacteria bacterium]|nr:hypothetical protein [Gammaproteobacteria bacterium]